MSKNKTADNQKDNNEQSINNNDDPCHKFFYFGWLDYTFLLLNLAILNPEEFLKQTEKGLLKFKSWELVKNGVF